MNVIKFTIIFGGLLSGILVQGVADDNLSYDLEKIVTLRGKTFQDILILNADQHGLLFRHREGIAKLSFSELSAGLRGMYESIEDTNPPTDENPENEGQAKDEALVGIQIEWVIRNRFYPPPVQYPIFTPAPILWPQHWPRYYATHNLVNPYFRNAVLQDFLYTAGIRPLPPGVNSFRLPRPTPWNFY